MSDASSREPPAPKPDIWSLPDVLDVRAVLVRFRQPLIRYRGRERVEHREAVEMMVTTSGPIPVRALSPVLMVGETPVEDYKHAGQNLYQFLAFDRQRLREGAPVRLAWPEEPSQIVREPPVFELRGEELR